MRGLTLLIAVVLSCGFLLVVAAFPAAAAVSLPKRECPDIGPRQTDVGLYKIITRKMLCGKARAILRDWYHDPTQKDSGPAGWRCAEVLRRRFEVRSYCHRDGRLIAFTRYAL
jgi:hypothetical protein